MRKSILAAVGMSSMALAVPVFSAPLPNACDLITAAQDERVIGPVQLRNLEGTGTTVCIVDGKLVTSVSPANSGAINALNHSGFITIPGIPVGRYGSKAPRSLYAIKHHVVVEIRVASGATVSKAKLVRLMKLALART